MEAIKFAEECKERALKRGFEIGGTPTFSHIKVICNKGFTIVRTPLWTIEVLEKYSLKEIESFTQEQLFKKLYNSNPTKL